MKPETKILFAAAGLVAFRKVWSLETLELLHTLPQPAMAAVSALLSVREGVWAGVGSDVVLWGRSSFLRLGRM